MKFSNRYLLLAFISIINILIKIGIKILLKQSLLSVIYLFEEHFALLIYNYFLITNYPKILQCFFLTRI